MRLREGEPPSDPVASNTVDPNSAQINSHCRAAMVSFDRKQRIHPAAPAVITAVLPRRTAPVPPGNDSVAVLVTEIDLSALLLVFNLMLPATAGQAISSVTTTSLPPGQSAERRAMQPGTSERHNARRPGALAGRILPGDTVVGLWAAAGQRHAGICRPAYCHPDDEIIDSGSSPADQDDHPLALRRSPPKEPRFRPIRPEAVSDPM